jgi:hypothetical protein
MRCGSARATLFNVKTNVIVSLVLKAGFLVLAITGQRRSGWQCWQIPVRR